MAKLAKFTLPRKTVQMGDGPDCSLSIRGLSPSDIVALMKDGGGDAMAALYARVTTSVAPADVVVLASEILATAPILVAHAIARAADEPDQWEAVLEFPTGLTLDLVLAIGELTLGSEAAFLKKLQALPATIRDGIAANSVSTHFTNTFGA